jgi:transcriptional regulator with XRE-family HTH domain
MIEADKWFQEMKARHEKDPKYWVEAMRFDFVEEVERMMEERSITRAELARRMDASPAYVTQMFKALFNPTLLTLAKVALAFDARVELRLVPKDAPLGKSAAPARVPRRRERRQEFIAADRPDRGRKPEFIASDKPATRRPRRKPARSGSRESRSHQP